MFSENNKTDSEKNLKSEENLKSRKIEEKIYNEYLECLKELPKEVCKDLKLSFDRTDF